MGVVEVRAPLGTGFGSGIMWKAAVMDCSIWACHTGMGKAGTAPTFVRVFSTRRP